MAFVRASGRGSHFDFLATLHVANQKLYLGCWLEKSFVSDEGEIGVMCGIRLLQMIRNLDGKDKLCAIHDISLRIW